MRWKAAFVAAVAGLGALTGCTQTFTTEQRPFVAGALNQGHYGIGFVFAHGSYESGNSSHVDYFNWFSFDLEAACEATKVTLKVTRGEDDGHLNYQMNDVTTPADVVNNPGGTPYDNQAFLTNQPKVREDLSGGVSYGNFSVPDGQPTDVVSFTLNDAGLAAFNAARGGFFTVGGEGRGFDSENSIETRTFRNVSAPAKLVAECKPPPSPS
jgi:hypothetical protein